MKSLGFGLVAVAATLSVLAIAACVAPPSSPSAPPPAQPAAAPAVSSRQAPAVAESACLTAVSRQTREPQVSVLSSEFSQANSLVMVGVGPKRAPWRCLVSNDGKVAEVSFAGSEGAL